MVSRSIDNTIMLEHIKTIYKIVEIGKNGKIIEIEEFEEREKAEEYLYKIAKEENHKRCLMIDEEEIFL